MNLFTTVAYATGAAAPAAGQGNSFAALATSVLPLAIIIVLFYVMLIRPQRKKEKETKAMINALKVGDKVLLFSFNNHQMYYVAERIEEE